MSTRQRSRSRSSSVDADESVRCPPSPASTRLDFTASLDARRRAPSNGLSQRYSYASLATSIQSDPASSKAEVDASSESSLDAAIDILIDRTVELLRTASESLDLTIDARDHVARFHASEDRLAHDVDESHSALARSVRENDRLVLEADRASSAAAAATSSSSTAFTLSSSAVSGASSATSTMTTSSRSKRSDSTTSTASVPPSLLHTPRTHASSLATPVEEPSLLSRRIATATETEDKESPTRFPAIGTAKSRLPSGAHLHHHHHHHRRTSTLNVQSHSALFDAARIHAAADPVKLRGSSDNFEAGQDSLLKERLKSTLSSSSMNTGDDAGKAHSAATKSWWWR